MSGKRSPKASRKRLLCERAGATPWPWIRSTSAGIYFGTTRAGYASADAAIAGIPIVRDLPGGAECGGADARVNKIEPALEKGTDKNRAFAGYARSVHVVRRRNDRLAYSILNLRRSRMDRDHYDGVRREHYER